MLHVGKEALEIKINAQNEYSERRRADLMRTYRGNRFCDDNRAELLLEFSGIDKLVQGSLPALELSDEVMMWERDASLSDSQHFVAIDRVVEVYSVRPQSSGCRASLASRNKSVAEAERGLLLAWIFLTQESCIQARTCREPIRRSRSKTLTPNHLLVGSV